MAHLPPRSFSDQPLPAAKPIQTHYACLPPVPSILKSVSISSISTRTGCSCSSHRQPPFLTMLMASTIRDRRCAAGTQAHLRVLELLRVCLMIYSFQQQVQVRDYSLRRMQHVCERYITFRPAPASPTRYHRVQTARSLFGKAIEGRKTPNPQNTIPRRAPQNKLSLT